MMSVRFMCTGKNTFVLNAGEKLELRYISKIVNSDSPEAKYYDFSVGDTFLLVMLNLEQDISIALNAS